MKKRYHVVSRLRFGVFLSIVIGLAVGSLLLFSQTQEYSRWESYRVSSGDSLWSIARRYAPEQEDVRNYIAYIQDRNGLTDHRIRAGQVLWLPMQEEN